MSSNKTLALALCLAITGCAQTPQNNAESGHKWWQFDSFGSSTSTDKSADASDKKAAPAVEKPKVAVTAAPAAATTSAKKWWWPFDSVAKETQAAPIGVIPMPDPKVTQAWLDEYEPRLRTAIKGTDLKLERRENLLVVVASADSSFKATRPDLLMPSMLGPFTRVAKVVEGDPKTAVLVLGHADSTGAMASNTKLSLDRAKSVAAIFRMSGLQGNRLTLRGMGSVMPRAANDSNEGRALNRRVEIMMTPQATMVALVSQYAQPALTAEQLAAVQPAVAASAAKKAAAPAKKATVAKKATPAKKAVKPAPAKKAVVAKTAAAKKVATNDQAKN
ncbi:MULTISPECIES: OmpA family protein [unclassified Pseudomonas]|uniref:OmpA family protein n=1 Tax=unclassified Pseudomonas TaxID=196821 RepID=UPI00385BD03F